MLPHFQYTAAGIARKPLLRLKIVIFRTFFEQENDKNHAPSCQKAVEHVVLSWNRQESAAETRFDPQQSC